MKIKKIYIILILFLLLLIFTGCNTQNSNELSGDLSYLKIPDEIYILPSSLIEDLEEANNKILEINNKIDRYKSNQVSQELLESLNQAIEVTYAIKSKKVHVNDSKFIKKIFSNLSTSEGKIINSKIENPEYVLELVYDDIRINQEYLTKGYVPSISLFGDGTVIIPKFKENIEDSRYIETKLDLELLHELKEFVAYTK